MKRCCGVTALGTVLFLAGAACAVPLRPDHARKLIAEGGLGDAAGMLRLDPPTTLRSPPSRAPEAIKCLVILVNFDDVRADTLTHSVDWFRDMLFSSDNPNSMRSYFLANSFGGMDVTGDVYAWFDLPQPLSYYADNRRGMGGYPRNAQKMIEDAVDAADPFIDYSLYDSDGPDGVPNSGDDDGVVDFLLVVHAGRGYEWTLHPGDIHSHASRIRPRPVDGVHVVNYATESEDARVGLFAHELGHLLGLPDLYDVTLSSFGLGMTSLMAYGSWGGGDGSRPVGLNAWSRMKLGFIDPVVLEANRARYGLACLEDAPEALILWNDGSPGPQYFIVENRRAKSYDSYLSLFGEGLYIYHVDERAEDNSGEGRHLISLEQADGRFDLERARSWGFGSDEGDPYPGETGNREFSWQTTPSNYSYEGTPTQVSIRDISDPGDVMTFDVEVNSPVLLYEKHAVDDSGGDGDREPDPGETIVLDVRLRNYGIGCTDLTATLTTEDPYVTIEDAVADLPSVGDSADSDPLSFVLRIGEDIPEPHDVHFNVLIGAVFGDEVFSSTEAFVLGVPIRALAGWPRRLTETVYSSPVAYDLDGDGIKEIILGCYDRKVYAWKSDGTLLPGWPFQTGGRITSSAAVCDIDIDGVPEVIIGSQDGRVYSLEPDGTLTPGWPQATDAAVRSSPVLADVDDDGMVEIVCGSMDGRVYVWNEDGTPVEGFPVSLGDGGVWMSPAAGDLDGDHVADIVAGTYGGMLHILNGDGTPHEGWPVLVGNGCGRGSPAIADLDGDGNPEIIVSGLWSNSIYVVGAGGHVWPGWPRWAYNCPSLSAPVPADIDNDGLPEVAVSTSCGTVIAWEADGEACDAIEARAGYPIQNCAPVFGDLNGNGRLEALVGTVADESTGSAEVQAFGAQGPLEGFPVAIRGKVWASPAISDLDGDGNVELVLATTAGVVQVWRFVGAKAAGRMEWPSVRGDIWNTGYYGFVPKGNEPLPDLAVSADDITFSPVKPRERERMNISFTLRNAGHVSAEDFSVGVYHDGVEDSLLIRRFGVESLAQKSDTLLTVPWRVPGGEFSRVIHVVVDAEDMVVERFDLNNTASRRFYLSVPDLAAEITTVGDLPATIGGSLRVSAVVANDGEDVARAFGLAFYDSVISEGTCFASLEVDSLPIGGEVRFEADYYVGPFRDDFRRIWLVADRRGDVLEYHRGNNVAHFDVKSGIQGEIFAVPGVPPVTAVEISRSYIAAFSPWCQCVFSVEPEEPYPVVFEDWGEDPDIAWNTIVYASGGDIVGYGIRDTSSFVVSADVHDEGQPAVWGDNIVWVSYAPAGPTIKLRTGQDSVKTVRAPGGADLGEPDVSGGYVVWQEDGGTGFDIYAYDLDRGSAIPVCTDPGDQVNPRIWGEIVVWQDLARDDGDIYMADLATGEKVAVAAVEGAQVSPAVCGDFIVWQDDRNGNWDIYAYSLAERREFPVCRQVAAQTLPTVADSTVMWIDARGTYTEVRGLKFGGIRRVAEVERFTTLSQDGAVRIMLGVREYDDGLSYRLYRYPDARPVPEGDRTHLQVEFELGGDTAYVYVDTLIAEARKYFYTVGVVDGYGRETHVGPVAGSGYRRTPQSFVVGLPYPNPVRRDVRLVFGLPRRTVYPESTSWPVPAAERRVVEVSVCSVEGRVVRRLLGEEMAPGYYEVTWDGVDERGVPVASGVYFVVISVDGAATSRKVVILD